MAKAEYRKQFGARPVTKRVKQLGRKVGREMKGSILGMKGIMVLSFVLALMFTSPTWAQNKGQVHRARTDGGYWYIKQGNPQKISHYMREIGLTYLEWAQKAYEAHTSYVIALSAGQINETAKLDRDTADTILDQIESRMKINTQAPGDKDFLDVLEFTRVKGRLAGHQPCYPKDEGSCALLQTFIACKAWVRQSIDSGIFEDSWHDGCYGDWDEKHKDAGN